MNIIKEFIENHESLFAELKYLVKENYIHILLPDTEIVLSLSEKQINRLLKRKLPNRIPGFTYYKHYGFSYENYGEFLIGQNQKDENETGLYGNTMDINLSFKLQDAIIRIDRVSPIFILLLEPFYKIDENIERLGLADYYYTLQIYNAPQIEHRNLIIKSLFYLNSYYLKPSKTSLMIHHIEIDLIQQLQDTESIEISRTKMLKRKDFKSIEPLMLYNDASCQSLENGFFGFYRILEFFFTRALETELKKLRYDKLKTEKEIIIKIQSKDEKSMLKNLLNHILKPQEKNRLTTYLKNKGILKEDNFDKFSNKLYEFRNSLVHSKETQLETIYIPDPFSPNTEIKHWNYIAKNLAEICINRLNVS